MHLYSIFQNRKWCDLIFKASTTSENAFKKYFEPITYFFVNEDGHLRYALLLRGGLRIDDFVNPHGPLHLFLLVLVVFVRLLVVVPLLVLFLHSHSELQL